MRISLQLILLTGSLFLALNACKKYETIPSDENAIWPLELGNKWTYADRYQMYQQGQLIREETDQFDLLVFERSYRTLGDEKTEYYRIEYLPEKTLPPMVLNVRADGPDLSMPKPQNPIGEPQYGPPGCARPEYATATNVLVSYPISSGTSILDHRWYWMGCSPAYVEYEESPNGEPLPGTAATPTSQVGPLDTLIRTPAGDFECLRYGDAFWSVGTGFIKASWSGPVEVTWNGQAIDSLVRVRELISFELQ